MVENYLMQLINSQRKYSGEMETKAANFGFSRRFLDDTVKRACGCKQ